MTMQAFLGGTGGLIRYSAIIRELEATGQGGPDFIKAFRKEVADAGQTCSKHGKLDDPIVGVDMVKRRIIVGCPWCSGAETFKVWEAQR